MHRWVYSAFVILLWSCSPPTPAHEGKTPLAVARALMERAGKCALITIDSTGHPQVRTMDPFLPDPDFTIWLATNPDSRKVTQLSSNQRVTLYYADYDNGYVSVYGLAELVEDVVAKKKYWKEEWKSFYPNYPNDYLLIKVRPLRLEMIDYQAGYAGDSLTWQPEVIWLEGSLEVE